MSTILRNSHELFLALQIYIMPCRPPTEKMQGCGSMPISLEGQILFASKSRSVPSTIIRQNYSRRTAFGEPELGSESGVATTGRFTLPAMR